MKSGIQSLSFVVYKSQEHIKSNKINNSFPMSPALHIYNLSKVQGQKLNKHCFVLKTTISISCILRNMKVLGHKQFRFQFNIYF